LLTCPCPSLLQKVLSAQAGSTADSIVLVNQMGQWADTQQLLSQVGGAAGWVGWLARVAGGWLARVAGGRQFCCAAMNAVGQAWQACTAQRD